MNELKRTLVEALEETLPKDAIVEALQEALPREVIAEAFKEGLGLFFSPFTGFWHAIRAVFSRRPSRRDDLRQYLGAE
jgi:hypothetical protein